ncbi:hypothetical protein X975_19793, partial [Stegodyphus mimosarum]
MLSNILLKLLYITSSSAVAATLLLLILICVLFKSRKQGTTNVTMAEFSYSHADCTPV